MSVAAALNYFESLGGVAELLPDGRARLTVPPGARAAADALRADPEGVRLALRQRLPKVANFAEDVHNKILDIFEDVQDTLEGGHTSCGRPPWPPSTSGGPSLKGLAVEIWHDGLGRLFIVADEADAHEAMARYGVTRGEVWSGAEIELIAKFTDRTARETVARFKRTLRAGPLRHGHVAR